MAIIYLSHVIKANYLGAPVSIDDFLSFSALFNILNLNQKLLLIFPIASFFLLFLINIKINKKSLLTTAIICCILWISLGIFPQKTVDFLNSRFKYEAWDQLGNYRKSGGSVYLIYSGAHFSANRLKKPNENEVAAALKQLNIQKQHPLITTDNKKRNVYLILMEGLWDPTLLKKVQFSDDPLDPEFRKLWDECGNSWAMSPVYGGETANAEFEILTGHPSNLYDSRVMFQTNIRNDIPALPNILSDAGYETIALHPFIPTFWNRLNVYPRLGFDYYYSIKDFTQDDLNDAKLSNISLYQQSWKIINENHNEKPRLTYIVTLSGHWPFRLNKAKRPPLISSNSSVKYVEQYANSVRYNTGETMHFVKIIRKNDPNALIVIMGDHTPLLGSNFAAYSESGILTSLRNKFTAEMYKTHVSTPLIIINGTNGPLEIGTVAMYEVPAIITKLLKIPTETPIDILKPKGNLHVRTLEGMRLVIKNDNSAQLCKDASEDYTCKYVNQWLTNVKVIDRDILIGEQFALPMISSEGIE